MRSSQNTIRDVRAAEKEVSGSIRLLVWCVVITVGGLQVWAHRHEVAPDGISYIEIARMASQAGWRSYVNGYWSPLYPFLLKISFQLFHPTLFWESTVVHLANFAIYLANLACFEIFLKELIRARGNSLNSRAQTVTLVSPRVLWIWGSFFFLWGGQFWVTPSWVTPDLCVAGLIYLATAMLLRIYRGSGNWRTFGSLGAVLGLGYLAKSPIFLLAFVFLICGYVLAKRFGEAMLRSLFALGVFILIAAPLVVTLSKEKGRLTFGDSGKINYAEFVDGAPKYSHWQGDPPGTGVPIHATRKLLSSPALYEFAAPIHVTYPPWYDPSYWYEGIHAHFAVRGQLIAVYRTASSYLRIFSVTGVLYVVLLAVFLTRRKFAGEIDQAPHEWIVWAPSFAALGMYALVHVEPRFVGGFGLMLLMRFISRVRIPEFPRKSWVTDAVFIVALAPAIAVLWSTGKNVVEAIAPKPFEQWEISQGLHETGISAGTEAATIGSGLNAYWAHLAKVPIVAEIPDQDAEAYWGASAETKARVMNTFARTGAKIVVTNSALAAGFVKDWQPIAGTHYYFHRLADSSGDGL